MFCEQRLDGLATEPEKSSAGNLPYKDINHLRECITSLKYNSSKLTKIVLRNLNRDLLYPVVSTGFYVGDQDAFAYYPFPGPTDLENVHHRWWNSATSVSRF